MQALKPIIWAFPDPFPDLLGEKECNNICKKKRKHFVPSVIPLAVHICPCSSLCPIQPFTVILKLCYLYKCLLQIIKRMEQEIKQTGTGSNNPLRSENKNSLIKTCTQWSTLSFVLTCLEYYHPDRQMNTLDAAAKEKHATHEYLSTSHAFFKKIPNPIADRFKTHYKKLQRNILSKDHITGKSIWLWLDHAITMIQGARMKLRLACCLLVEITYEIKTYRPLTYMNTLTGEADKKD